MTTDTERALRPWGLGCRVGPPPSQPLHLPHHLSALRGAPGLRLDALVKGSHLREHGGGLRHFHSPEGQKASPSPKGPSGHPWVLIKSLAPVSRAAARAPRTQRRLPTPAAPWGLRAGVQHGALEAQTHSHFLLPSIHVDGQGGAGAATRLPLS